MATKRHRLLVSYTSQEMERVRSFAAQMRLSISETHRRLMLGAGLPSASDFAASQGIRDLLKANADLARLGNLLKLTLDDADWSPALGAKINRLLEDLVSRQNEIKDVVRQIHHQLHPRSGS